MNFRHPNLVSFKDLTRMRLISMLGRLGLALGLTTVTLGACDMGQLTVNTTAKVLARAQPSLKMESDYELAARALPATLKTVEGFWVVSPDNAALIAILTEGFCQYGVGFVEDEWEQAVIRKDFEAAQYHSTRATKMFLRCMNYALKSLGSRWQKEIFADSDTVKKLIADTGAGQRTPLMWAAIGLASAVNQNKDNVEMVAQLSTAKLMLLRVVELDDKRPVADKALAALPHVALGMVYTAASAMLGGDPAVATAHFKKALELTGDRFLLARVQYARRVGVMTQDRALFHAELLKVLATDPAIWPEQRLANEIAHRRARRYLSIEKELF